MKTEQTFKPRSGFIFLILAITILGLSIAGVFALKSPLPMLGVLVFILILKGLLIVNPNQSRVLTFFGEYVGTVKENGFYWINPFILSREKISLKARNFDSERLKVNDMLGNPILISVILVWQVKDTFKAAFEVDDYQAFVRVQTDAAVRALAGKYPYDNFDDDNKEITLRSGLDVVNEAMEDQLSNRLDIAGIEVIEARIGYLAYASEIAGAMLKRQQATAIVAAREKIVEGAVGMVEMALEKLSEKSIIEMDDERKAAMVSNLMIVLCSDRDPSPVINTGTLNP